MPSLNLQGFEKISTLTDKGKDCGVSWNDLALFAIFDKRQIYVDQVYFYEFNSKKSATLATNMNDVCV